MGRFRPEERTFRLKPGLERWEHRHQAEQPSATTFPPLVPSGQLMAHRSLGLKPPAEQFRERLIVRFAPTVT